MTIIPLSLDHQRRPQHMAQALVLHDRPHIDLRLPVVALLRQGLRMTPVAFTKLLCRKRRAEVSQRSQIIEIARAAMPGAS
ncbi:MULTISPECIES: hypothetical protein [unclassified Variovorax]|uniref:hypothetical protein n=1 Tax=unclassified Variovorax TaxID=663243 RepID=UPI000B86BE63|nr:hypothetical protein [Variovorax sp. CF079]